jgi:hypothetical protein
LAARSKKFFAARRAVVQSSTRRLYQVRALAGPKLAWSWLITVHIDYEWIDGGDFDGATVFEHAQSLGLEGIVSKHKNSRVGTIAVLAQDEESGERGGAP